MNNESRLKNGLDMIYLSACALHNEIPNEKIISSMDIEGVMSEAERHSMNVAVFLGIKKYAESANSLEGIVAEETFDKWKNNYSKVVKKTILFDIEREKLISFFEKNGIWYLPLKGIILQNFYPQIGMRQMADNDILFDKDYRSALKNYMLENGYSGGQYVERTDSGAHDTYLKNPFYNFEMHYSLHPETEKNVAFRKYYDNVRERLVKDEDNACGYHMRDEDFYVYFITHAYRHYAHAGNGVRAFMDVYVYLSNKHKKIDLAYIDRELAVLGIADFEKKMRTIAFKLFSADSLKNNLSLTASEEEFIAYHIGSGVYGTTENAMNAELEKISNGGNITGRVKFKYFVQRLIPSDDCYKLRYPWAYKHRILIPIAVCARFFEAVFKQPKKILKEIRMLKSKK